MNYVIENNLDWNALLYDNLCINDSKKYCLISGLELTDGHITLPCNHTFNYLPIYYEIINQKQQRSNYEIQKLKLNQIKCPYCRTIHNNLLPYYKSYKTNKIIGVNSPEKYCLKLNNCEYLYKSGKKKGCFCSLSAFNTTKGIFCNLHNKNNIVNVDNNNEIDYTKLTIPILKELLRKNNCKVGGNKSVLIERILNEKKKIDIWKN